MLWAALLCLFQESAPVPPGAAPAPRASPGEEPERMRVNRLDLIVNDQCLTHLDMMREIWRRREPIDPEDQDEVINQIIGARIDEIIKTQAGKDLGFDEAFVHRLVEDQLERREESAGSASLLGDQLKPLGLDSGTYHENTEASILARLWSGSTTGIYPGPGGRHHVDRVVRPGRLYFEYQRNKAELALPATVTLQELAIDAQQLGDLREAEELAADLRERILLGEDFGAVAVEAGRASDETRGVLPPLEVERLRLALPELGSFLDGAELGELSPVLPVRSPDGVLRGYRVVKLLSRDRPEPPPFSDGAFQQHLTERIQENLDQAREGVALARLLHSAYVWPPEAFGRAPAARPPAEGAAPKEEAAGTTP